MGEVYRVNQGLITSYPEQVVKWKDALLEPGKEEAEVTLAALSAAEVRLVLLKLDMLAMERNNQTIAMLVAEEVASILMAVRMVKANSKQSFQGLLGTGASLDICWLRPRHVGGLILNPIGAASKGVHNQTILTTYPWLFTHTAAAATDIVPSQIMSEYAAVVHLGAIDPIEVPKIEAMQPYLAGIQAPAQSCEFRTSRQFGSPGDLPVVRWEKPIIAGPLKTQRIAVYPYASGDDKMQLLSLLIAQAQDLVF